MSAPAPFLFAPEVSVINRLIATIRRLADLLETATAVPLIAAGAVMVAVVLVATFFRYVLNSPLMWSEELARYLMIWIGLVGAAVTMRHGEHIRINAVRRRLPRPVRMIGDLLVAGAMAWFLWIATRYGWEYALRSAPQVSPSLGISMQWPLLAVPVAGALMLIQHVLHIVLMLLGAPYEPEHEKPESGGLL